MGGMLSKRMLQSCEVASTRGRSNLCAGSAASHPCPCVSLSTCHARAGGLPGGGRAEQLRGCRVSIFACRLTGSQARAGGPPGGWRAEQGHAAVLRGRAGVHAGAHLLAAGSPRALSGRGLAASHLIQAGRKPWGLLECRIARTQKLLNKVERLSCSILASRQQMLLICCGSA